MADLFFKHPKLPFAECRRSRDSSRHYKPHMHKTFCIGAVDLGEVLYRAGGRRIRLAPGSLALINPETLHSCNPDQSGKRDWTMLFLDVDWCLKLQQSLWQVDVYCPVNTVLLKEGGIYEQFVRTVELFIGQGDLLEKEQALAELGESVFLKACEPRAPKEAPCLHIQGMKSMLGKNLDLDISMDRIAQTLGANPYTLLRQFKSAAGLTPHAFRLNCRIEHARKLLQQGRDISQVALACGFYDQSHFHRHFKAVTTMTPKAYQINFIQ